MPAIQLVVPRARRISDALLMVVSALIGLSLVGQFSKYVLGHPKLKGFVPTFYVDLESTVPTWYSSIALGLTGALLGLIAAAKFKTSDKFRWHWALLCGLFFFLSMDEIAGIHELLVDPLREALNAGGLLHYTWVIPGAATVVIVGCLYLRFFLNLPRRTQGWFFLAATLFVGGAIGVEMLSGANADLLGEENLDYALIVTIEEFLEMLGIVVFIRGILDYIEGQLGELQFRFTDN